MIGFIKRLCWACFVGQDCCQDDRILWDESTPWDNDTEWF
ncbi:hypothetical protein Q026_03386 [Pseudomonas aeruginosa BWHPSA013]|nr:hypothetical protein Q026_03386 [Pseudomonas aeruginosa BWHPSA013]